MPAVKFWGTRGSLPVSQNALDIRRRLEDVLYMAMDQGIQSPKDIDTFLDSLPFSDAMSYGGNTSCVEIGDQGDFVFCDMGSGLRVFADHFDNNLVAQRSQVFHFFVSHMHWDHIMGFPFFTPAYCSDATIHIYGCHPNLEEAIRNQHSTANFPVAFEQLSADIQFHLFQPGETINVNGFSVEAYLQLHEGDSYGYRFSKDGKSIVYSTDAEHKVAEQSELAEFVNFIKGSDLVIFDAMYSLLDAVTLKEDWGHSSNLIGVELCLRAAVKQLCLFHHDPAHSDEEIDRNLDEAKSFAQLISPEHQKDLEVVSAWDGLMLNV